MAAVTFEIAGVAPTMIVRINLEPGNRVATADATPLPGARGTWASLAFIAALGTMVPAAALRAETVADKAQLCAACHGGDGIPQQKTTPVIWGQHQGYLYLNLRDYKSGARKNDIMSPLVRTLERDDMMALALYFSQKPWPDLQQPPAPADVAVRALRANTGIGCSGCHQSEYQGEGTQPRLAGQWKEYLQQSMMDFRNRTRGNNPGMTDLMLAISPDDIAACAEYLAGLTGVR
jgi:cytochrome c553